MKERWPSLPGNGICMDMNWWAGCQWRRKHYRCHYVVLPVGSHARPFFGFIFLFVFSFERRRALVDGQKRDAVAWRLSFSYVNGDNGLNKWKDSHPVFSLLPPIVLYLFYVKGKDSKPSIMDGIEPLAAPPTHLGEYTNWFPCAVACDTDQSVEVFVFFLFHMWENRWLEVNYVQSHSWWPARTGESESKRDARNSGGKSCRYI